MGLKKDIIKWTDEEWPERRLQDVHAHLLEELKELVQALENNDPINIAEELFDVYAMIIDYCDNYEIDLKDMFRVKKMIVEKRKKIGKQAQYERDLIGAFL